MKKEEIVQILDEIFIPLKFKRKGNNWVLNGSPLTKVVNLQKSNFSDDHYINYEYIISGLELDGLGSHVHNRLSEISEDRLRRVAMEFETINTEEDLLNQLKTRPHLNDIPLVVKEYFKLPLPGS